MGFEDMVVYLADGVPEQQTRDAVKHAGSRLTSDLHMPQSSVSRVSHHFWHDYFQVTIKLHLF